MSVVIVVLVLLVGVFLYCIQPNKKRLSTMPVQMYAHRGLHQEGIPENSLAAFVAAKQAGFGVELDVQITADQQVVVFHDADLIRMCGIDKKLSDLTYDELSQYKLANTEEIIPLLKDVLQILEQTPIILEIKAYTGYQDTEICDHVVQLSADYPGHICIESFSPYIVQWFKQNQPEIIRGQLAMNFIKERGGLDFLTAFVMTNLLTNFIARPDFIAYHFSHDSFGFWLCRKVFKPYNVAWTIRKQADYDFAVARYSVLIFENNITTS